MSDFSDPFARRPRPITKEVWHKASDLINTAAIDHSDPCHICGGPNHLLPSITDIPAGVDFDGNPMSIPAFTTVCDKCGYIRHFSAKALGLWSEDDA